MDEQQQQRINQAAQELANAMVQSQRTMTERGVSAQEMNAQLTQQFFNNLIENLQRMGEETRGASQELADQTQRAQEAARSLTQESAGAYMDFMNSLFAMSQGGPCSGGPRKPRGGVPRGEQHNPTTYYVWGPFRGLGFLSRNGLNAASG